MNKGFPSGASDFGEFLEASSDAKPRSTNTIVTFGRIGDMIV